MRRRIVTVYAVVMATCGDSVVDMRVQGLVERASLQLCTSTFRVGLMHLFAAKGQERTAGATKI